MKNLIFTLSVLTTLSLSAQTFETGFWKSKTSLELNGIPLPDSDDQDCITKDQIKDVKGTIEKGLKKKGCTLNSWNVTNNNLKASLTCKNKDVDATGEITGTITKKSYDLKAEAKGKYKDAIPATADIKLTGHLVAKTCPKEN